MSRRCVPRRFPAWLSAALALAAAGAAAADDREPRARTVLGGDRDFQACANAPARQDFSDAAIAACDDALERRQSSNDEVLLLINRGVIHLTRGESPEALADFDAALVVLPRHPEAHLNRGAALVQMGRPGPAVAALTDALSLGVSQPYKAYYNRGAAREALGDLRGAYEDYSTALEIRPDWGPAEAEIARFVRTRQERLASILNSTDNPGDGQP
jgi:tetratricopeptide (TPR) repeat protein